MDIKRVTTPVKGLNIYLNKVVSDTRGSYCDMAPGGTDNPLYADGIKHIHASIAINKFIPRGGHYHFRLKENFFTLSGTALWYFYDFNKNSPTFGQSYSVILGYRKLGMDVGVPEYTIDKNCAAQVAIEPGVYHVFWPLTDDDTVVAGTGTLEYDAQDYDRTPVEQVPGAMEVFERVKAVVVKSENKQVSEQSKEAICVEGCKSTSMIRKIKAIISAAKNNQHKPFSYHLNKHLLPLGGRPIIFYSIEHLVKSGIEDIGIIVGEADDDLMKIIGDGSRWGVKITYFKQKELLGVGGALLLVRDYVKDEPFILYLGDNIAQCDIASLVNQYFAKKLNAMLLLARIDKPQRFGVPEIQDGKIIKVEERPMYPLSDFAVSGVYIYDQYVFKALENLRLSDRGQYEISDIHNYYINNGLALDFVEINQWWKDRGNAEDLLSGNRFVLENITFKNPTTVSNKYDLANSVRVEGSVLIGNGARIVGKTLLRGPLVIGENCFIKDSYVGPYTSIGSNTEISGAEIENSIIMNYVNIYTNKRIIDSVVGSNSSIVSNIDVLPKGQQIVTGEFSVIKW